ncbi:hypothetical protein FNV43_RR26021 [Rhamnella rubrinervis]|uniref:Protein kinase domain-containing protein n=1 Tax=Rhamnella rubrinervis TaxID=2594499 RepID=A0A8K0GNE2_9ROSA|nr:hypothetical protein FNV43_RR26021 [Rhamnella rubrinervis]
MKCKEPFLTVFFVCLATISFVLSQSDSATSCVLDIDPSSSGNNSNCEAGSWGGFVNYCCGEAFDDYLYALARRANQTQKLFLNSTEQKNCLLIMKSAEEDVLGCGIEKLTSGASSCSDYTIIDVVNNLGNTLKKFDEDCNLLGSAGRSEQACSACLKRWKEIVRSSNNGMDLSKAEAEVCSFAVLVTMTSSRIGIWNLAGGLAGSTVIILVITWFLCKKRIKERLSAGGEIRDVPNDSQSEETSCLKIPMKEVYSATDNFNASNFIGQGVAGKVYKGKLSNGEHVAVKHIIKDGYVDTFIREVRSLSHVRHPNLVALLGYCEDKEECFLVYELCHNGNLSEWLFEGCIVHRDIKPTNILINAKFQAKLSDFGLSKVMDLGQSYVSSEVRGTFGYVDPEYRKNHRVNASGDVYSFGMVLLQLLSGRRVINLNLNTPMPLTKMARLLTAGGNIEEFADPKLNSKYSMEAFNHVFKLALSCTGPKQQRPSMEQVVLELEKALEISMQFSSLRIERKKTFLY